MAEEARLPKPEAKGNGGQEVKEIKITPVQYIKEVRQELSKVSWPTRGETIRLTLVVIAISVVMGFFIGGLDFLLAKITETFLK